MLLLFSWCKTDEELHILHLNFSPVTLFCIHCSISPSVCPVAMEIYEEMDTI